MNAPALRVTRVLLAGLLFLFTAGSIASATDTSDLVPVVTHDNIKPAGQLKDGVLTVRLTLKEGAWHPDANDAPAVSAHGRRRGWCSEHPGANDPSAGRYAHSRLL